jgi:hypothetical protein
MVYSEYQYQCNLDVLIDVLKGHLLRNGGKEAAGCQATPPLRRSDHKSALPSVSLPLSPLLIGAQHLTRDVHQYRLRPDVFASYAIDLPTDPMAYAQE